MSLGRERLDFRDGFAHGIVVDRAYIDRLGDILEHGEDELAADVLAKLFETSEKRGIGEDGVSERKAELGEAAQDAPGVG